VKNISRITANKFFYGRPYESHIADFIQER
jgi:hypothetical protein